MKKFLLILLFPLLAYAGEYKSRFFAGGMIAPSKVDVGRRMDDPNAGYEFYWGKNATFSGFWNIHIYGGWEFRPLSWVSLSPAIGFNRNGWSWDRAGHTGGISYVEPYLRLELLFHIKDFYLGGGGTYGYATFFWGEQDGKNTTENMSQDCKYTTSGYYTMGYTIKEHYRVGLNIGLDYIETDLDSFLTQIHVNYTGISFTYLF